MARAAPETPADYDLATHSKQLVLLNTYYNKVVENAQNRVADEGLYSKPLRMCQLILKRCSEGFAQTAQADPVLRHLPLHLLSHGDYNAAAAAIDAGTNGDSTLNTILQQKLPPRGNRSLLQKIMQRDALAYHRYMKRQWSKVLMISDIADSDTGALLRHQCLPRYNNLVESYWLLELLRSVKACMDKNGVLPFVNLVGRAENKKEKWEDSMLTFEDGVAILNHLPSFKIRDISGVGADVYGSMALGILFIKSLEEDAPAQFIPGFYHFVDEYLASVVHVVYFCMSIVSAILYIQSLGDDADKARADSLWVLYVPSMREILTPLIFARLGQVRTAMGQHFGISRFFTAVALLEKADGNVIKQILDNQTLPETGSAQSIALIKNIKSLMGGLDEEMKEADTNYTVVIKCAVAGWQGFVQSTNELLVGAKKMITDSTAADLPAFANNQTVLERVVSNIENLQDDKNDVQAEARVLNTVLLGAKQIQSLKNALNRYAERLAEGELKQRLQQAAVDLQGPLLSQIPNTITAVSDSDPQLEREIEKVMLEDSPGSEYIRDLFLTFNIAQPFQLRKAPYVFGTRIGSLVLSTITPNNGRFNADLRILIRGGGL